MVCVTPCEERHPESSSMYHLCLQAGLNSSSFMKYSWEVAVPGDGDGLLTPFHPLADNTLFASPHTKILDSMFFARHFRVRCVAQPIREEGQLGVPLRSKPVTIGNYNGICQTPVSSGHPGRFQSQSFVANLVYVNSSNTKHPNTVKVEVSIPHQDGMIPLVSTLPLHNLKYLLTQELYRAHHLCSNLYDFGGFIRNDDDPTNTSKFSNYAYGNSRPYQWNEDLREVSLHNFLFIF